MKRCSFRRSRVVNRICCALGAAALVSATTRADWPSDPASPLVIGEIQSIGLVGHAAGATPDGALWTAWVDTVCWGEMRLQRVDVDGSLLMPGGLAVYPDPGCGVSTPPKMMACADNSVVLYRDGMVGQPLLRVSADGAMMWGDGLLVSDGAGVNGGMLPLPNGDVIAAWHVGWDILVDRLGASGASVWGEPTLVPTGNSSNMRIFGLVDDGAGGAFIVWDFPGAPYVRIVKAAHVTSDGVADWGPIVVVPASPGSSRHTDPVALADGSGGVIVVWVQGSDSGSEPVPMFMQRLAHDGALVFEGLGVRVSLETVRQFHPKVDQDAATGDVFIAWNDGILADAELRVQRMSLSGARLWGESGVAVAPMLNTLPNGFEARLFDDNLVISVADVSSETPGASVTLHRVDGGGVVIGEPWVISDDVPAGSLHATLANGALAVSWLRDGPGSEDLVVAQRVNADGSIGSPALVGDINLDGIIDSEDRFVLCSAIGSSIGDRNFVTAADLNGDGAIDELDLAILNDVLPTCGGDVVSSATFQPPGDGVTDAADLAFLLGAWAGGPSCADFVSSKSFAPPPDGMVDAADLAFLLGAWGACE